ncbi:MAG: hypothetical protein ABI688_03145 [Bacteroidota bacterium]
MKKIAIVALLSLMMGANCKKNPIITPQQQDLLVQIMTDGLWSVTLLNNNGTDMTQDFAGYRFKFYENKTVDATFNGSFVKQGVWDGSAATMTTSTNFTNASHPLIQLNGSWHVDHSGSRFVEATQTVGSVTKNLKLYKE